MAYSLAENRISWRPGSLFLFYEGKSMFFTSLLGAMCVNAEHATES